LFGKGLGILCGKLDIELTGTLLVFKFVLESKNSNRAIGKSGSYTDSELTDKYCYQSPATQLCTIVQ
jgi:hypothetical protein